MVAPPSRLPDVAALHKKYKWGGPDKVAIKQAAVLLAAGGEERAALAASEMSDELRFSLTGYYLQARMP